MSAPTIVATIRQVPEGGYSAELAGHPEVLSAPDFESLLQKLRESYHGNGTIEVNEDDVADASFERELEETIAENAELYRRLAP